MPIQSSFFVNSASIPAEINQSLRFDGSSYLSWTPGSAGNRRTWTWSGWVKRGAIDTSEEDIFGVAWSAGDVPSNSVRFSGSANSDQIPRFSLYLGSSQSYGAKANGVARDAAAWMHLVAVWDSSNATESERMRFYINGEQQPRNYGNGITQNTEGSFNTTSTHRFSGGSTYGRLFKGYLAETHFVDGTALDPTDFGEYDNNGVWRPIKYIGSYGTNGFYLKFDPTAANGIGHDHSGNGNNWTASGFTTSGSGSDIFTDTPTTNESLFNFNQIRWGNGYSLSWGQEAWRYFGGGSNGMGWGHFQTINGNSSGKYCWASGGYTEYIGSCLHGVGKYPNSTNTSNGANVPYPRFQLQTNGNFAHTGLTATPSFSNPVASSQSSNPGYFYCWFAWDIDAGKLWVRSASTDSFPGWSGDPAAGTGAQVTNLYPNPGEDWGHFIYQTALGGSFVGYSFSGNHFSNFVPNGFTYLNASAAGELAITNPGKHFKAVTYTGTSAEHAITGVGFQPDLVWIKGRTNTTNHVLVDSVRGATKVVESDSDAQEYTDAQSVKSFDADGFTLGTSNDVNNSAVGYNSYVAWCWKAGGAGVSNTDGSITSTVSANLEAGFSIVTYDSNPTGTVGHGLNAAPDLIIEKKRDVSGDWLVTTNAIDGSLDYLKLNLPNAAASAVISAPTSTVFTPNSSSDSMVAYCFASVEGYSKFGSYIGNSSTDGPYVYCGFKPAWVMVKRTDTSGYDWEIFDSARGTYNVIGPRLWANLAALETSATRIDFLSNGFKIRDSGGQVNGGTILFAAFAESPSGGNNVSPATAR